MNIKNYLRYLMNLNCSCRTPGSCSTGSLRSAAENARPVSGKIIFSSVARAGSGTGKKLNVLLNILASQLRLSVVQEGKTTYVLLSEINNITLPELNACYSQKLIRWHEQSFGL